MAVSAEDGAVLQKGHRSSVVALHLVATLLIKDIAADSWQRFPVCRKGVPRSVYGLHDVFAYDQHSLSELVHPVTELWRLGMPARANLWRGLAGLRRGAEGLGQIADGLSEGLQGLGKGLGAVFGSRGQGWVA